MRSFPVCVCGGSRYVKSMRIYAQRSVRRLLLAVLACVRQAGGSKLAGAGYVQYYLVNKYFN